MALAAETPAPPMSPQVVGNAFVEQYYQVLYHSPESVYKFYQESSNLSRPNSHGIMTSVTTTQAINDVVLSFDYKNYIAEIMTVDSQPSDNDGVFILVTGCLTGQDKVRRKFTQSFFLALQNEGVYFVQNDIFRFVDEARSEELNQVSVNSSNDERLEAPVVPGQEPVSEEDHHPMDPVTPPSEVVPDNCNEACQPPDNEDSVVEEGITVDPPVHPTHTQLIPEATSTVAQVDVPKKSYASIVKVTKGSTMPARVYVPTTKTRPSPVNPEKPLTASTTPAPATKTRPSPANPEKPLTASTTPAPVPQTPAASSNGVSGKSNSLDAEGHSIYIRHLPLNITPEQVEEEFKKFGPIKPGGVQVRSHKIESFCFGFVEFESLNSMQAAIKASPITIGGRKAFIEEKRTTTRVINGVVTNGNFGGGRGRYPPGRGGFQNDNFRERGGGFQNDNFRERGGGFQNDNFRERGGGSQNDNFRERGGGFQNDNFRERGGGSQNDNFRERGGGFQNDNFRERGGGSLNDNFRERGGGFQNDNFRERGGGFGGNQGYGRSDFRNRGDYSGRGRGAPGRGGESYRPRVFQNGDNDRMGTVAG